MRNTDQMSNVSDNANMMQHPQLREIVVKKTAGGEGSLNYLSIPQVKRKLPDEKRSYEEPLSPVACLTTRRLFHSYISIIVGFRKYIDVASFKISLLNTLAQHQRFSSILVSIPSHFLLLLKCRSSEELYIPWSCVVFSYVTVSFISKECSEMQI